MVTSSNSLLKNIYINPEMELKSPFLLLSNEYLSWHVVGFYALMIQILFINSRFYKGAPHPKALLRELNIWDELKVDSIYFRYAIILWIRKVLKCSSTDLYVNTYVGGWFIMSSSSYKFVDFGLYKALCTIYYIVT